MLIYNSKKEFVGIEENDLNAFGFSNLSQLRAEAADFADMFVKTPGYIHNFKHVNWIDFLTCSDSAESPKVIIHANSKSFKCTLDVKTAYLTDEPSSKAFLVYLNNIRELTDGEHENISGDIVSIPTPIPVSETTDTLETEEIEETKEEVILPQEEEITQEPPLEPIAEIDDNLPALSDSYEEQIDDTHLDLDLPLDLDFHDEIEVEEVAVTTPEPEEESLEDALKIEIEEDELQTEEVAYSEEEVYDNGYIYNPQIASDELGLPVDLIEEFIEDFVAQAKEFKDELYSSLDEGNSDNVKILSHKLKGVAANLRIEDAFEVLTIINTSQDNNEVKTNLDTLYKIISKLSGEKIVVTKNKVIEEVVSHEADIFAPSDEAEKLEEPEQNDEIEIDFKDEYLTESIPNEPNSDIEVDDEFEVDFKSDEPLSEPIEVNNELENLEEDEIEIDFKSDEPEIKLDEATEDPVIESEIADSEVPERIDFPELIDDEFLNQSNEEKIEVDNTLDMETISDKETLSLESESIEVDDIELLEGHNIEDGETLDTETLDIENLEIESVKPIEYNKTNVANEIGIPHDAFLELFDDYITEAEELSDSIIGAIESNNSKVWQNKAVQLKGMSDNMRIHEFTKELETLMETQDTIVARDASDTVAKSITEISKLKG